MTARTDDLRIAQTNELISPEQLVRDIALEEAAARTVSSAREAVHNMLNGRDDRLLVIVGPCSIHDPEAALEYAALLRAEAAALSDDLCIIMRVYFEKPRTTIGWKG
ncbi:MAG: 3-deoxy-7-phosphoheptulonate synthase, partial [Halioglobus sp.]|nr:3-deoxy-7-phosphoheptulonate synthase [Halioglobus sp.]